MWPGLPIILTGQTVISGSMSQQPKWSMYTWSPQVTFRIFTDQELHNNELLDAGSRATPQSINRILGISGTSGLNSFSVGGHTGSYGGIWTSGHLHLYGENVVLYIQSPELASFNSSQGPQGESTIMRRINTNNVPYGSFICDKGSFELDYFIAACHPVKNLYHQTSECPGERSKSQWPRLVVQSHLSRTTLKPFQAQTFKQPKPEAR